MTDWPRYRLIQRLLHWGVALVVIPMLAVGSTLGILGFEGAVDVFGPGVTNTLYVLHKTGGVLLLGLMAVRVITRLKYGRPHYAIPIEHRAQRVLSEAVHGLFYIGLIAMPVLGWAATATGGYPINFFQWVLPPLMGENKSLSAVLFQLHGLLGWALIGLLILHISGGLYHWLIRKDGVMTRMSLLRSPRQG